MNRITSFLLVLGVLQLSATANPEPGTTDEPEVIDSVEHTLAERTVRISRVRGLRSETQADLEAAEVTPVADSPIEAPHVGVESEASLPSIAMTLSATVVDRATTFLRWQYAGAEYQAWSNVDFNLLSGIREVSVGEAKYAIIVLVNNSTGSEVESLPHAAVRHELVSYEPELIQVAGIPNLGAALAGILGLHELFRTEKEALDAEFQRREAARLEREEASPSQPEDVYILLQKKQSSRKIGGGK
jgi:hypothetical protein